MKTNYSQKLAQCIHDFLKSIKAEYTFNSDDDDDFDEEDCDDDEDDEND